MRERGKKRWSLKEWDLSCRRMEWYLLWPPLHFSHFSLLFAFLCPSKLESRCKQKRDERSRKAANNLSLSHPQHVTTSQAGHEPEFERENLSSFWEVTMTKVECVQCSIRRERERRGNSDSFSITFVHPPPWFGKRVTDQNCSLTAYPFIRTFILPFKWFIPCFKLNHRKKKKWVESSRKNRMCVMNVYIPILRVGCSMLFKIWKWKSLPHLSSFLSPKTRAARATKRILSDRREKPKKGKWKIREG